MIFPGLCLLVTAGRLKNCRGYWHSNCFLSSQVLTIVDLVSLITYEHALQRLSVGSPISINVPASLGTNFVTTMLIAYKLWLVLTVHISCASYANAHLLVLPSFRRHGKVMKIFNSGKRKTSVQKVLIILVEAGVIYLGFQVLSRFLCEINYDLCISGCSDNNGSQSFISDHVSLIQKAPMQIAFTNLFMSIASPINDYAVKAFSGFYFQLSVRCQSSFLPCPNLKSFQGHVPHCRPHSRQHSLLNCGRIRPKFLNWPIT